MQDLYPEIFRFSVSLFPSEDDDVVTSPYNSVLSLSELVDHADAVLPIENQALHDIVAAVDRHIGRGASRSAAQDSVDLLGDGADACMYKILISNKRCGAEQPKQSPYAFVQVKNRMIA